MSTVVVAVVAVVFKIKASPRYLIVRRNQAQSGAGYWEFPGGKVEPDESPEEALRREIEEELQVTIDTRRLSFLLKSLHQYTNKKIEISFYLYEIPAEVELVLVDHDDFKWCDLSEMLGYKIADADVPLIHHLQKLQKGTYL